MASESMPAGSPDEALAWVGLGANLGEPEDMVERALTRLDGLPRTRVLRRSSLYRSPPMGPADQPDYVNAVAGLDTGLAPQALMASLLELEVSLGRRREGVRWGPRHIDLDLLCYGAHQCRDDRLTLPHPGVGERAFVLLPLAEVTPALEIPGQGRVRELLAQVDTAGMERIGE